MVRMRFSRVASAVGSLGALLWAATAQAECTKDTDCKGDRVCSEGICVSPPPAAAPAPAAPQPAPAPTPVAAPPAGYTLVAVSAPAPAPPPKPETERYSTGLMVAGIFMVSTGPIILILGLANSCVTTGFDCASGEQVAMTVIGTAMIGVGVPLIVIGSQRVPIRVGSATISPWLTPHGGGAALKLDL